MKQLELTEKLSLEQVIQEARNEDIVLVHQGHAVALVSEFGDDELYWYRREHDPEFLASLERGRTQVKKGQTVSHEELKQQIGLQ